jgi:predicted RNA binding protein YcfA (HicA-like mRNA interferase family)
MSRLSPLTYRQVIQKLRTLGYVFDRQAKGSHEIWRNPASGTFVTVPNHPGSLPLGTLRAIIRQTGLPVDEFMDL